MKKNNKAFTLIELLAIIVILAIIAVITVPIILNIIDNAKMGSVQDSAYGYRDAINKYYVSKLSSDNQFDFDNKKYSISELSDMGVSVDGQIPLDNSWVEIYNNNVVAGCLQFDDYKVDIADGKVANTEKGFCSNVPSVSINIVSQKESGKININDEISIGDEHFYVVSTNSEKTVLLAKYNLYVGRIYQKLTGSERIDTTDKYTEISSSDDNYGIQNSSAIGYTIDGESIGLVMFANVDGGYSGGHTVSGDWPYDYANTKDEYNQAPGNDKHGIAYYVNNYVDYLKSQNNGVLAGRLLTNSELESLGGYWCWDGENGENCGSGNHSYGVPSYLHSTGYWLDAFSTESTQSFDPSPFTNCHLLVYRNNVDCNPNVQGYYAGVRPVIEVSTSSIEIN